MTTPRVTRSSLALLACLLSVAFAQIDARSKQLLDGMVPPTSAALTSLDQTMVMTIFQPGQDPMVTRTRTVIDYANERAAILTELGDGMSTRLVFADGQATMSMPGMPMSMPAPPQMDASFSTIFDPPQDLANEPNAKAVYDGIVSYGEVVTGQQVTYTGTYDMSGTPTDSTFKFLFDDAGTFIATVIDVPDAGLTIMVFDGPVGDNPRVGRAATLYSFDGTTGTVTSKIAYENVRVNEAVDETAFE